MIRPYEARNTIGEEEVQLKHATGLYTRAYIYYTQSHLSKLGVIALGNEMKCVQSYERREADGTEYVDCGTHYTQL